MTKEEFIEKFGDGKTKIQWDVWPKSHWVIASTFGRTMFSGLTEGGDIYEGKYELTGVDGQLWKLFQEPKPEFQWDRHYMWGKEEIANEIDLFVKTSFLTWNRIDAECNAFANWTKKQIKNQYEPIAQPDNWKDYGLEKKDLIQEIST